MKPADLDLVKHRLRRAQETLGEAKSLFDSGYIFGVVNRAYYACFYAVIALLLTEGLTSSKHTGVQSLFGEHWIKAGRLPPELGRFYNRLSERRQAGDYQDIPAFDRADAETWLGEAEGFIDKITDWLRQNAGVE